MKRNYKRDYEFQKKINAKQAEEIESLKTQIDALTALCNEKDKVIYSIEPMRNEFIENTENLKSRKKEYDELINELKKMKKVIDQKFFKGRWKLVKFLIK